MSNTIRDELANHFRWRESHSWQRRGLRWAVLEGLAADSPEFQRATATLVNDYRLPLSVHFHQIEDIMDKLAETSDLPKRQRPPKEWKNTNWSAYLLGLARLCVWYGLLNPLSWVCPAGQQRPIWLRTPRPYQPPLWVEALHYFLQEQHRDNLARPVHGSLYRLEIPLPNPLPWADHPPRRRGRPALDASGQRWEELQVLARCIAKRLLDRSWEQIADNCGLTTRKGFDLMPLEVTIRCQRLAKTLQIYRPL